jgi:hypothetical protein
MDETVVKQLEAIDAKLATIRFYAGTIAIASLAIAAVVLAVALGELTLSFDLN